MSISNDELVYSGRDSLARDAPGRPDYQRTVCCVVVHAEDLWHGGGAIGHRNGNRDRICVCLLPDVGVFARAVCRRPGRELFPCICQSASGIPLSARFVAGTGSRCGSVLLFTTQGCDRGSGRHSPDPAISGAGDWIDSLPNHAAGDRAPVSHVAVSGARVGSDRGICFYSIQSRKLAEGNTVCGGYIVAWPPDLHDSRLEGLAVAVWAGGY